MNGHRQSRHKKPRALLFLSRTIGWRGRHMEKTASRHSGKGKGVTCSDTTIPQWKRKGGHILNRVWPLLFEKRSRKKDG